MCGGFNFSGALLKPMRFCSSARTPVRSDLHLTPKTADRAVIADGRLNRTEAHDRRPVPSGWDIHLHVVSGDVRVDDNTLIIHALLAVRMSRLGRHHTMVSDPLGRGAQEAPTPRPWWRCLAGRTPEFVLAGVRGRVS